MPDLLIYGEHDSLARKLRHGVPCARSDAFDLRRRTEPATVFVGSLEIPRIEGLNGIVTVPLEDLGIDEALLAWPPWYEAERGLVLRACRRSAWRTR